MSSNRPLTIPGRRKVITKNMILEAQKHTKSNMAAAKWMGVHYSTYKKYAKMYNLSSNAVEFLVLEKAKEMGLINE